MLALYALPVLIAAAAPAGQAPPTPPPLVSPAPTALPSPAASPAPAASPTPTPLPAATTTPNPFTYVVKPSPAPGGGPQILEIALNDKVLRPGGQLLVQITTSPEITRMVVRTMGREIGVPLAGTGVFSGQQTIPGGVPSFLLNRTYQIDFIGTTADGKTATATIPVRFER